MIAEADNKTTFFSDAPTPLAICIQKSGKKQNHTGFFCKEKDGRYLVIHLGYHNYLKIDPYDNSFKILNFSNLDSFLQEVLVEQIIAIARVNYKDQKIPYSILFSDNEIYFNDDLSYKSGNNGKGLTCATFVLAVLKRLSLPIAAIETWPNNRPEDIKWFDSALLNLYDYIYKRFPNQLPHVAQQYAQKKQHAAHLRRFRPEEVAACAPLYFDRPLNFPEISGLSAQIKNNL